MGGADLDCVCRLTDFTAKGGCEEKAGPRRAHKMYLTHNLCLHGALKFTARRQVAG